jgi:integrase
LRGEIRRALTATEERVRVREFVPEYLMFAPLKLSTKRDYTYCIEKYVLPSVGEKQLHLLCSGDVLRLQRAVAHRPARANRAVNIVCGMARTARRLGYKVPSIERPRALREGRRERYLTREEAHRLFVVLDREPSMAAIVVRLLLLTGMRRGEVLQLKWEEVDLGRRCLRLCDSKTGARTVPLSSDAAELLAPLPRLTEYVFPGRAGHVRSFERVWRRLRREAGLEDVRVHDLRHSWASFAVSAGVSLALIGSVLGHRSPQTTMRYAHVSPEAGLQATALVSRLLREEPASLRRG